MQQKKWNIILKTVNSFSFLNFYGFPVSVLYIPSNGIVS